MLCPERALWARRHEPGLVCEVLVALFHGVASVGGGGGWPVWSGLIYRGPTGYWERVWGWLPVW